MPTSKTLIIVSIAIAGVVIMAGLFSNTVFGLGCSPVSMINGWRNLSQNSMMEGGGMMGNMMSQEPQDVVIKTVSSQQVQVGRPAQITLLVLDKNTGNPLTDAQVTLGLEKGAPMSTMNMIGQMFDAENIGDGKYVARFTAPESGYYTLHTHVIPAGKSMMSMMENHMDIGIVAK
ncbi:MAG TPA: FixH family protein [Candidatus Nitrosotalea sp.]|nr:FixH family protein [Candidatus Nitrosotalea sp.]